MIQAISAYLLIFVTIFLSSVAVSFTILSGTVNEPNTSKFRILQQKKIVNRLLKNYNKIATIQDSLERELIYKKIYLQEELNLTDSLIKVMEINQKRLKNNDNLILKNKKVLSKYLK